MPFVIAIIISFLISLIICSILKSGMKNVAIKEEAYAYTPDGLTLTDSQDRYTHTTTTRTKIQSSTKK